MSKIKKAVIPAAGLGTGFLPATKAFAKEMLPIVDTPIIQFIVEEAIASGIEEIIIVTGKTKRPIEDHFDSNIELEENLKSKNKTELLELVHGTTKANLFYVRQSYPLGLGDAILQAKAFIGDEPFVVMLGDNIMEGEVPVTKQLIDLYEETGSPNVAVVEVPEEDRNKYGIIQLGESFPTSKENVYNVESFIEKPTKDEINSNIAIAGRYVLPPQIFDIIENQKPGKHKEVQLTDSIDELNKTQRVFAQICSGQRYDVGDKLGYMKFMIKHGLTHPETKDGLKEYIKSLSAKLKENKPK